MLAGFRSRWTTPCSWAACSGEPLVNWQRPATGDEAGKRVAFDELQYQRADGPGLFESVYRGDVRMIQRREHLRFALEAREAIGVGREGVRQDLQRNVSLQPRVAGTVHLAHATGPQRRMDFVHAKSCTGSERHRGRPR